MIIYKTSEYMINFLSLSKTIVDFDLLKSTIMDNNLITCIKTSPSFSPDRAHVNI